ncbi:MAG: phenylalanine--tRNA ligase subunit alpha [Candidatus Woesearchaeota archaeon]
MSENNVKKTNFSELVSKFHPLERKVFPLIENNKTFEDIFLIAETQNLKDVEVMRAIQWLENKNIVKTEATEKELLSLDKNGFLYLKKGFPEKRFLNAIKEKPLSLSELKKIIDESEINISIGLLRKNNLINVGKDNKNELIFSITEQGKKYLTEKTPEEKLLEKLEKAVDFENLSNEDKKTALELLKRKEILKKEKKTLKKVFLTELGLELKKIKLENIEIIDKLTPKDLKEKTWKNKTFRGYDVEINVPKIYGAKRHITLQAVEYIKSIWLELGFKEMTGNCVHTSFWDLDALFVPQDHPAREMQDTFYLKQPSKGEIKEKDILEKVKETHENGWTTNSLGWQNPFSIEKSKENLLRTHTTVLSAQTLSKLKKSDLPAKFFAVGKCFRNETLDWKHLFEFYQVEGIVVDEDANFSNLLGYLKEFFKKMGYLDVRIRPGHFPYTEPSAEVDVYHPIRKEWVELGGAGIFRPEVVKPLIGFNVPVLAWGLGLDRLIKEYWKIEDIRDLYKNDLKQLRELKIWLK